MSDEEENFESLESRPVCEMGADMSRPSGTVLASFLLVSSLAIVDLSSTSLLVNDDVASGAPI